MATRTRILYSRSALRARSCRLAVLGLLVMGLLIMGFESVTDLTMLTDTHGEHAHAVAAVHHSPAHGQSGSGGGADPEHHDHCGHTCRGHVTSVGPAARAPNAAVFSARDAFTARYLSRRAHAPPTPPPNA